MKETFVISAVMISHIFSIIGTSFFSGKSLNSFIQGQKGTKRLSHKENLGEIWELS